MWKFTGGSFYQKTAGDQAKKDVDIWNIKKEFHRNKKYFIVFF